jgi:hypothetical protein
MTVITIPYTARKHFQPLHDTRKRWVVNVAHRRAGKSVAQANHLIRAALRNQREFPPPKYAYVGPSFAQTKDLIWGYMQQYAGVIPGTRFSETDLTCHLPNGARISLYGGSQAYERIRGLYLDGAVLDEMPLLHPNAFDVVVRPARGQVTKVPYDRSAGVVTAWDLGMHDANPIWFIQRIGREIHVIDFLQAAGKGLDWYAEQLRIKGYNYIGHIFPHDVKARELGTGRARFEILEQLGLEVTICRDHKPEDGIAAVRSLLPTCYFDEKATEQGLICLKSYQAAPAPSLGTMHARPLHNWASHAADSFRYLAIGLDQVIGWSGRSPTVGGGMRKWVLKGLAR